MTALLQLIPLGDEMLSRQFAAYYGRDLPPEANYGRNPQADEFVQAFSRSKLDGLTLQREGSPSKSWALVISDAAGERLRIDARLRGKDKDNVLFTVTGDRHLLEILVAHLPASCGSFLISTDGLNPLIVTSGAA